MKTEKQFGTEYAKWMHETENLFHLVDVAAMCNSTSSIPDGDYSAMISTGIENPSPREYWRGYNEYMSNISKNPAAVALGKIGGSVKSEAKAKSSAANAKLGGRPRTFSYAIQAYNADLDTWEYKFSEPMSREEAAKNIKQLRQWAKDDASGKKYRTVKVVLASD